MARPAGFEPATYGFVVGKITFPITSFNYIFSLTIQILILYNVSHSVTQKPFISSKILYLYCTKQGEDDYVRMDIDGSRASVSKT